MNLLPILFVFGGVVAYMSAATATLYHHPIAVTFLATDAEVAEFKRTTPHVVPVKSLTFCQWKIAARMQGKTVLGTKDKLFCTNAQCSFGWHEIDEGEIKSQLKYCVDAGSFFVGVYSLCRRL